MFNRATVINLFRLSRREYFADFFITPPLTLVFLLASLRGATWWWSVEFAGGLFAWTLYEYLLHRFVLHRFWLLRDMHGLHHADQRDYIALHPIGTIGAYAVLWLLFGLQSSAVMVGFSIGYTVYSFAHTAFHYGHIPPGDVLFGAKRRHAIHHMHAHWNYGVTTPLWDWVFGTMR